MLEIIIIVLGLVLFVEKLFDKWSIFYKLQEKSANVGKRWMYDLLNCRFCLMFWMSVIITTFAVIFVEIELKYLLIPMIVTGLKNITK